jgi:pSer/pThr/pTyr-binding forkhead associated (FHA) protein
VIRAAARDLRIPQESFVLAPAHARGGGAGAAPAQAGRLVVVESPSLVPGRGFETGPVPLTFGRAGDNSAVLSGDDFASSHHARVEAQRDGIWILDLGSTNGTWVNGERMDGRRKLREGDRVKIGQTELRFER